MKARRRALCMIIALIVLAFPGAVGVFGEGGVTDSSYEDDGAIRVYLKSLGDPEAMYLTLAGEYVIEETGAFRFDRGAEITLAADGDDLLMSTGPVTLNMGSGVTFTRCAADEGAENGIYIYESERNALYEGDLTVYCADGKLRPVLSISMEDYLKGVVAYEMSDSFPIEALKAQAVAARTYALSRKSARAANDYDVTDTTSDQVFKGYIADYANVIQAVSETSGVVGMYKGNLAVCYYTASNGGVVAEPNAIWGGSGDDDYILEKADPYDLENPKSLVNSYTVPKNFDESNPLWKLIQLRVSRTGHVDARADSILSVDFSEPVPGGMYKSMDVTVSIAAKDEAWLPVEFGGGTFLGWAKGYKYMDNTWMALGVTDWQATDETQVISFSVFDDIKDGFSLGLNSADYEVVSCVSGENDFTIEMRRFGHGVGMSQRGAQTMAGDHGMSYVEILNFYYPGMTLEKISWQTPDLPVKADLPRALASERLLVPPVVGDLGELNEGEYFGIVTLENTRSRLNVRSSPSTDASIAAKLDDGYRVAVSQSDTEGWVKIRGARFEGYVKEEYIRAE